MAKATRARNAVRNIGPTQGKKPEGRSSFIAAEAVEALDYDFAPHGGSGSIAEPSSWQVDDFRKFLARQFDKAGAGEDVEDKELNTRERIKLLSEMLGKDGTEDREEILSACSAMCSGSPSIEELSKLPYRTQQAFFGWLTGVFLNPEA